MAVAIAEYFENIIHKAKKMGASDVHFEPMGTEFGVRFRIDGVLQGIDSMNGALFDSLNSHIKVLAHLNITQKRLPQDGRLKALIQGSTIDIRVSILPTSQGESINLRILDTSKFNWTLDALGMPENILLHTKTCMNLGRGLVLVTGPTGSGKTTTLYSILSALNQNSNKKIVTVEDPVEYTIEGIQQICVNEEIALGFSTCLRAFLRQDPDVLLIGEIRDIESAKIALHAALTGHLVFTTLHTQDAISAVHRLLHLKLEPYLIAACLHTILAQRLVRKLCPSCKEKTLPGPLEELFLNGYTGFIYKPKGCQECYGKAYKGRLGLFECLRLDEPLLELIRHKASHQIFSDYVHKVGFKTLKENAIQAIIEGKTTKEEVIKHLSYAL